MKSWGPDTYHYSLQRWRSLNIHQLFTWHRGQRCSLLKFASSLFDLQFLRFRWFCWFPVLIIPSNSSLFAPRSPGRLAIEHRCKLMSHKQNQFGSGWAISRSTCHTRLILLGISLYKLRLGRVHFAIVLFLHVLGADSPGYCCFERTFYWLN